MCDHEWLLLGYHTIWEVISDDWVTKNSERNGEMGGGRGRGRE